MKGLTLSAVIIILLALLVALNSCIIGIKLGELLEEIDKSDGSEAEFSELYDRFMQIEKLLSLSINDTHLYETELAFGECIESARLGNDDGVAVGKSRLIHSLMYIRRISGFNIKSIF